MKKILLLLGIIITTSCGDDKTTSYRGDEAAVKVKLGTIASNNESFLSTSGTVEAVNSAKLSTRMMGYVERIPVKTGDKVRKGSLLVRLNNAELSAKKAQVSASIAEAEVARNNAEKDLKRFKALFADNSASQKELDDMRTRYEMAAARVEAARQMKNEVDAQFKYTNIRAPFDGVVTGTFIDEGNMASPGMPLIAIEGPSQFEVTTRIPENEIDKIQPGLEVKVKIKAIDTVLTTVVSEVSPSAVNSGGQFVVKAVLDQVPKEMRSGMYATVEFPLEGNQSNQAILIPQKAITTRGQLQGVYTVSTQNTAVLRWLRLGKTYGDYVEVLSGLAADESFILSSEEKLYNGAPVQIQQ